MNTQNTQMLTIDYDFSRKYFPHTLTDFEHNENNQWFKEQIKECRRLNRELYVPMLKTYFDIDGHEIKYDLVVMNTVGYKYEL